MPASLNVWKSWDRTTFNLCINHSGAISNRNYVIKDKGRFIPRAGDGLYQHFLAISLTVMWNMILPRGLKHSLMMFLLENLIGNSCLPHFGVILKPPLTAPKTSPLPMFLMFLMKN